MDIIGSSWNHKCLVSLLKTPVSILHSLYLISYFEYIDIIKKK